MKKTFYYNFLPTKAEEEASGSEAHSLLHHGTPVLVEIRDWHPRPPAEIWIEKVVQGNNMTTGKLFFSYSETFDHVFRHWTLDMANHIVTGNRLHVMIMDITDGNSPTTHHSESLFFEKGPHDHDSYALGCKDLVEKQLIHLGDGIGLRWNAKFGLFQLKIKHPGFDDQTGDNRTALRI